MPATGKEPSQAITEAFAKMLQNASPEIVDDVIEALASRGEAALPGVIRALQDEKLRPLAVQVALRLGAKAEPAAPALIKALEQTQDDPVLRHEIQFALGALGPAAVGAVPELINSLSEEEELPVRHSACYALGRIGPAAKDATFKLNLQMRSEDDFTPVAAVWALLRIHPNNARIQQAAVPLLTAALDDEEARSRGNRRGARRYRTGRKTAAIPRLKQALQDDNPLVRDAAEQALKKLQGE